MTSDKPSGRLRIGELAKLSGVTTRTIRYYHARGLLPEAERDSTGYRRYAASHVIALARVRRLRAVGMPIDRIAANLTGDLSTIDLSDALQALADELARQIDTLTEMRSRLLSFAASSTSELPAETLAVELRAHGLLAGDRELPATERDAAALVDALHPGGIEAMIAQTRPLMADAATVERFSNVLRHIRELPNDADDETLDSLVTELLDILPRPARPVASVDFAALDALAGQRLRPAQRRLMQRFRQAAAEAGSP